MNKSTREIFNLLRISRQAMPFHHVSYDDVVSTARQAGFAAGDPHVGELAFMFHSYSLTQLPESVVRAISLLAAHLRPASILDPGVGQLKLLLDVAEAAGNCKCLGIVSNSSLYDLAQYIDGAGIIEWHLGSTSVPPATIGRQFDLIVSSPSSQIGIQDYRSKNPLLTLIQCCSKLLTSDGYMVLLVPPDFFLANKSIHKSVSEAGLCINAAFTVEVDNDSSFNDGSFIIVLSRQSTAKMFIGKIGVEPGVQEELIGNFLKKKTGRVPELGTWKDRGSFSTFTAHQTEKEISQIAAEFGYAILSIRDFARQIACAQQPEMPDILKSATGKNLAGDEQARWQRAWHTHQSACERGYFLPQANSIYFPRANLSPVLDCLFQLQEPASSYFQIVLDAKICNAGYFAQFLNSSLGLRLRQALTGLRQVNQKELAQALVFMPPLAVQEDLLALDTGVQAVIDDLQALRQRMWGQPLAATAMRKRIGI